MVEINSKEKKNAGTINIMFYIWEKSREVLMC